MNIKNEHKEHKDHKEHKEQMTWPTSKLTNKKSNDHIESRNLIPSPDSLHIAWRQMPMWY